MLTTSCDVLLVLLVCLVFVFCLVPFSSCLSLPWVLVSGEWINATVSRMQSRLSVCLFPCALFLCCVMFGSTAVELIFVKFCDLYHSRIPVTFSPVPPVGSFFFLLLMTSLNSYWINCSGIWYAQNFSCPIFWFKASTCKRITFPSVSAVLFD